MMRNRHRNIETDRFEYSLPLNSCDGDPAPNLEMPLAAADAPLLEARGYLIDPPEGGSIGEVCAVDEPECG
jgi:hypothetical protein